MLETKDLCKIYKPKKGVPVTAVNKVSLRFPEKGVVFLLGKSGSGKSTMLNLLGGLDQYDSGEIIIKGVSSKDFTQQRFDSYRNTYVGFIFQEYNVLEEFTVGANIALALELQGKTATDEELNRILEMVDLAGFGDRKPNELSGGQKQRVAIARALVKNPEIIMADEPTGALDSNTGRQVLDTLKKLSEEKLVIIVSHDREYAEQYADRIIELADGEVIRDVQAVRSEEGEEEKSLIFRSTTIEVPADYHLTEEDRIQINEYLDKLRSGASLILPAKSQRFQDTDQEAIPVQDGSDFSLIKSVLPMKSAFKIGCSSLKHKRFRLVMTILLSVVAFTLFAFVDTFSSYDHIRACTDSLMDSDASYVSVNKSIKRGSGFDEWWSTQGLRFSQSDMDTLTEETGIPVVGMYVPRAGSLRFSGQYDGSYEFSKGEFQTNMEHFCGFAEVTQTSLDAMHFKLIAGKLPDGSKNEIAVSAALCDTFVKAGYHTPMSDEEMSKLKTKPKYEKINSPLEMVGKVIRLMGTDYTISGVIDTNFDLTRYDRLLESTDKVTTAEQILNYMLYSEYLTAANYSLSGAAMVGEGKVAKLLENEPMIFNSLPDIGCGLSSESEEIYGSIWSSYYAELSDIKPEDIFWFGDEKTELKDNEVIITLSNLNGWSEKNNNEIENSVRKLITGETEMTKEAVQEIMNQFSAKWKMTIWDYSSNFDTDRKEIPDIQIVGVIYNAEMKDFRSDYYSDIAVLSHSIMLQVCGEVDRTQVYDSAVGPMPESRSEIEKFVRVCYRNGEDVTLRYELNHPVTYELDTVNSTLKVLAKVFLYIGIGFAIFAALLMSNFITTSIHYKRREIGILRAIGSRSNDVFRIFFSESFVIALINFVLSAALCCTGVAVINWLMRKYAGILITILHFGIRQMALLLLICVGIAAIASFLPVRKIASKKPIDAIRDK